MPWKPEQFKLKGAKTQAEKAREYNQSKGTTAARGYGGRWQRARASYLKEHPLCVECEKEGRITPATVVDHVKPHRGDMELFWDTDNWQTLCGSHHAIKTRKGL